MGTPFIGEIKMITWNFAPQGWAFCNGQILPINQNQALFSILGTTYGGNGIQNFALPDLRDRTAIHMGSTFVLGQQAGEDAHTLSISEIPGHYHMVQASVPPDNSTNTILLRNNYLSNSAPAEIYNTGAGGAAYTTLSSPSISNFGGNQAHNNLQPYLVLNFVVALVGIFPSQN